MSTSRIFPEQILTIHNGCTLLSEAAWSKFTINSGAIPTAEPMHVEIEIDSPYDAADSQGTAGWLAHPLPLPLLSKKNQFYWRSKRRSKNPAMSFVTPSRLLYFAARQIKPVSLKQPKPTKPSTIKPVLNPSQIPTSLPLAKIFDNSATTELKGASALKIEYRHYRQWPQPVFIRFDNKKLPNSYTSAIAEIFKRNNSKTSSLNHKVFSFFKTAAEPQRLARAKAFSNKLNQTQRPTVKPKSAPDFLPKVNRIVKPSFTKNTKPTLAANKLKQEKLNYPDFTLFLIANENTATQNKVAAEHKPAAASLNYPDFSLHCFNSERSHLDAASAPQTTKAASNYPDLFLYAPNGIYSGTFFKAAAHNQPSVALNYADYSQHCAASLR